MTIAKPAKFVHNPIEVEAIHWNGDNRVTVAKFIKGDGLSVDDELLYPGGIMVIKTSTGYRNATPGDWIVKDPFSGECYPCSDHTFKERFSRAYS